jgi:hypothetical protein
MEVYGVELLGSEFVDDLSFAFALGFRCKILNVKCAVCNALNNNIVQREKS